MNKSQAMPGDGGYGGQHYMASYCVLTSDL